MQVNPYICFYFFPLSHCLCSTLFATSLAIAIHLLQFHSISNQFPIPFNLEYTLVI